MKRQLLVLGGLVMVLLAGSFSWTSCTPKKELAETSVEAEAPAAPEKPETPEFILAIQEKIKGKENLPAEEVFEDIQILQGMPAGRVLGIMRMAFSQSLGVRCDHCHVFNEWADNRKPTKEITREMWRMTGKINRELLPNIANLSSERAVVNCTTCHRGEVKPALNLQ